MTKKACSILLIALMLVSFSVCSFAADNVAADKSSVTDNSQSENTLSDEMSEMSLMKEKIRALYGENKQITDGNYDKSLAVKCVNGTFVGKKTDGVIAFKGIPFVGKQPVGEFRWKAPVEFVPDDGIYEAYYNGKSPRQVEFSYDAGSLYPQGEDCLYLNIWKADPASSEKALTSGEKKPTAGAEKNKATEKKAEKAAEKSWEKSSENSGENRGEKKPVMVWIHGGGYEVGGTADPLYECSNLVRENPDIIAVSIAYRVGVFGFFHLSHLPDGKDYPDAQNLGLMDNMMALKWIHENIANFGGDPDNVTIFGESAGAESVTVLPLIKGSQKYFKRVIAQSGSPVLAMSTEQTIETTNEVMKILGCKTVADLQKVAPEKMVEAMDSLGGMCVGPERDGKYIPLDPYGAYLNGAAKDIEILQGCNKDELNYFMIEEGGAESFIENMTKRMAKNFTVLTDEEKALVDSFLKDGESYEPLLRLYDQIWFFAPLFRLSENQTKAGGKSYNYYFTVESSIPFMKSGHAVEIASVLNNPENTQFTGRAFDETFSKTMRKMWVQFAKTGNPSLTKDISPDGKEHKWPLYNLKDKEFMVLDEFNIHPEKESELKLLDWERCYFLTKYYCL